MRFLDTWPVVPVAPVALMALTILGGGLMPVAMASSGGSEGEAPLTRPANAPDPDARGKVEIKTETRGEKFEVKAERVSRALPFEVFMEDALGSGNLVSVGGMIPDSNPNEDEFKYEVKTWHGQSLPFNVPLVSDLSGRVLRVQVAGVVYLEGIVPDLGSNHDDDGHGDDGDDGDAGDDDGDDDGHDGDAGDDDGDDDGHDGHDDGDGDDDHGGSHGSWDQGKNQLTRPSPAPDANAKGDVEVKRHRTNGTQKFEVEAGRVDVGAHSFALFMEDAAGSGVFARVGEMRSHDWDEAKLKLDTSRGDSLPFGVTDLDELADRMVEVRDETSVVYLFGQVPSLSDNSGSSQGSTALSGVIGSGRLVIKSKHRTGKQSFRLKLNRQGRRADRSLYVEDPATGQMVLVDGVFIKRTGKGVYKIKTSKGQSLPLGLTSLDQLTGLRIEIRDETSSVILSGVIPALR